jgi:integrase
MPAQNITDAWVRNITFPKAIEALWQDRRDKAKKKDQPEPPKPTDKQITFIETLERGLALVLVVGYGGSKTFRVLTYRNGKPHSVKLPGGLYPHMTVKQAKAKARKYWENPQKFEAQAEVGTFKDIAENWLKRHVAANKLRSEPQIRWMLERYVLPRWKDRPFLEIRRREVNELLDRIADDHSPSQADSVLAIIRGICNWYQSRNEDYVSPIVKGMKRNKTKARDRILNDDEIRAVWKAADDCGSFGAIVKCCLLTAQRRDKIATMQWSDIDANGVWTIASEDREKGNAGQLTLPKLALDVINQQPQIAGNPYVFASGSRKHFNSWSQRKDEFDAKLPDIARWTIHDLRRTARSLMSRADVRPDIAERVLGHVIAGVEGVYDRHSYDDHKTDALKRLAALIETILLALPAGMNVVPIKGHRGSQT